MRQKRLRNNRFMAAAMAAAVIAGAVSQPLAASEVPVQEVSAAEETAGQDTGLGESGASELPPPSPDGESIEEDEASSLPSFAEDEPSTELYPEPGYIEADTQDYLSASRGSVEVTVCRQGGNEFPAGMTVQLIPGAEMVSGSWAAFEEELKAAWVDTLYDSYLNAHPGEQPREILNGVREGITDSIRMFETYYVKLADASGSEAQYGDLFFDFHIRDAKLYSQAADNKVSCEAGRYVSGSGGFELASDNGTLTVMRHDEEKYLTYSLAAGGTGFFTLLTTDNAWEPSESKLLGPDGAPDALEGETEEAAEKREPEQIYDEGMEEETEEGTEEGIGEETGEETEEETGEETEEETGEETEEETEEGTEEETEEETEEGTEEVAEERVEEAQTETLLDEGLSLYASSRTPVGTRVTASGTGYAIVSQGDRTYSSAYTPVRAHANSVITPWNNAGSSVKSGTLLSVNGTYLIPNSKAAAGQFGFRVTNVSYNTAAKCNVDMLITVSNYNNYTYDSNGKKISSVYPFFGMHFTKGRYLGFDFDPRLPMMELKCDFVVSGTNTPVFGNYRMKMLDIDQWQRFGISMQNGAVTGKYALDGSRVYVGSKTAFDHSYTLFNGDGTSGSDDPLQSVMYELSNTSGIYLLIQLEYRNDETTTPEDTIKTRYEQAMNGQVQTNGKVSWDGTAYGATELTAPVKYVSNDGAGLGTSNTLPTSASSYYYTMDHFVPEEDSGYFYSVYRMCDDLPAGVDYDGAWSVVQMESGADVTSWFSNNSYGKHMEFNAAGSVLAGGNFYGYHYRFTFKVKMVPTELSPVFSGNSAAYTVMNTGYVEMARSSGPAGPMNTNTVVTTVTETRADPKAPIKGIDGDPGIDEKYFGSDYKEQDIVFSVFQEVPMEPAAWAPAQITMTDILQDVLEYGHCEVYLQRAGTGTFIRDDAWTLHAKGQTLTETRTYEASLAGATIRWDITCRVKEGADLDAYHQVTGGKTWAAVPNTAKTRFDWNHGTPPGVEQPANTVTVLFPVPEINVRVIKMNQDTRENIPNAGFTVYEWDGEGYNAARGDMNYDSVSACYLMDNLDRTNANEGRYKIVETTTPYGHTGSWEQEFTVPEDAGEEPLEVTFNSENPMSRGTITITKKSRGKGEALSGSEYEIRANKDVVSPQGKVLAEAGTVVGHVTTGRDGRALSKELYPGEYLVTEIKAPLGYALDADPQVVTVAYQNKDTPVTNVDVTFVNDRLYGTIELIKEIDAEDIVWAHGNPAFTFKIDGADVLDVAHTYYDTVEFTRENVNQESGKAVLKATFRVLAGTYTSSEEFTMRYSLEDIHDVAGGEVSSDGQGVVFDLSEGGTAAATFYNVKTTDEDEGHTDVVRNVIVDAG